MTWSILVVDDDESVAFFTRENLADLGADYTIEAVTSGKEAWQRLASEPFDLVIADLRMPDMTGLELLRRAKQRYPQTQLILMTAFGSDKVRADARQLQVYRYITKPFRMEDLLDTARAALEGAVVSDGQKERITCKE
jgi:CheY-like chemotaxis protein